VSGYAAIDPGVAQTGVANVYTVPRSTVTIVTDVQIARRRKILGFLSAVDLQFAIAVLSQTEATQLLAKVNATTLEQVQVFFPLATALHLQNVSQSSIPPVPFTITSSPLTAHGNQLIPDILMGIVGLLFVLIMIAMWPSRNETFFHVKQINVNVKVN